MCFNRTGKVMASASLNKTVRLWKHGVEGESVEFKPHTAAVRSVHFSPTGGNNLITTSDDKTVKMWTILDQKFLRSFATNNAAVRCAKYSPGKNNTTLRALGFMHTGLFVCFRYVISNMISN